MLGVGESYLRAIVRNEPAIKVRHIGGCSLVSYPQVRRFLAKRGVKFNKPYETRKSHIRMMP
jgi:hypothetical protein